MRLSVSVSKNAKSYYVVESTYVKGSGRGKGTSTRVVECLGTEKELREKLGDRDIVQWAKDYIAQLNRHRKDDTLEVVARLQPHVRIPMNQAVLQDGGYLFLEAICNQLGLEETCEQLAGKRKLEFDVYAVLKRLIETRILYPSSKRASYEACASFLEAPGFSLQHVYRALDVLADGSDALQARAYQASRKLCPRETSVLYYDCTNYFFEIEREDAIRRYGHSKENRPNPIVQMGLFMDGSGIPLAFSIFQGAANEQLSLKPLEETILRDFHLSKFIVCTDAGLGSLDNRVLNNAKDRGYVVTQSLKKLERSLRDWALDKTGWRCADGEEITDLSQIDDSANNTNILSPTLQNTRHISSPYGKGKSSGRRSWRTVRVSVGASVRTILRGSSKSRTSRRKGR